MQIAIFGKTFTEDNKQYLQQLINKLESHNISILFYEPYYKMISSYITMKTDPGYFLHHKEVKGKVDFLFSIGGDGTILDTINIVRDSGIPILGINMGRMGFLSSISKNKIIESIDKLLNQQFSIDKRTLLHLNTDKPIFGRHNYALNELAVYRKDPFTMLKIEAYINNEYLNSYWGDGLIIATPTGSTAYSLSTGGPIIMPGSQNFVITPIATHNLTVRPFVIPDNSVIRIKVIGRISEYIVSLDSRTEAMESSEELIISKEKFKIKLVQLEGEGYFKTIQEKLLWGLDIRNK
jgi:NAD+ kinase